MRPIYALEESNVLERLVFLPGKVVEVLVLADAAQLRPRVDGEEKPPIRRIVEAILPSPSSCAIRIILDADYECFAT